MDKSFVVASRRGILQSRAAERLSSLRKLVLRTREQAGDVVCSKRCRRFCSAVQIVLAFNVLVGSPVPCIVPDRFSVELTMKHPLDHIVSPAHEKGRLHFFVVFLVHDSPKSDGQTQL